MSCPAGCDAGFEPYPALQGKKCLGCGAIWNAMSAVWENLPPGKWVYVLEDGPVPPEALQDGIIEEMVDVMKKHVEAHKHTADEFMDGKTLEDMGIQTYTGQMEKLLDRLKDGEAG